MNKILLVMDEYMWDAHEPALLLNINIINIPRKSFHFINTVARKLKVPVIIDRWRAKNWQYNRPKLRYTIENCQSFPMPSALEIAVWNI